MTADVQRELGEALVAAAWSTQRADTIAIALLPTVQRLIADAEKRAAAAAEAVQRVEALAAYWDARGWPAGACDLRAALDPT